MDIAAKPSILQERSGIGSSDELDEYGVWIKSEPKDWTENAVSGGSGAIIEDISEAVNDDTGISEEASDIFEAPPIDEIIFPEEMPVEDEIIPPEEMQPFAEEPPAFESPPAEFPPAEAQPRENGRQTELLQTIAEQLSAIKTELAELKGAFTSFKPPAPGFPSTSGELNPPVKEARKAAHTEPENTFAENTFEPEKEDGFFGNYDNEEAIVLTGEELDYLNSGMSEGSNQVEEDAALPDEKAEESNSISEGDGFEDEQLSASEIESILASAVVMDEEVDDAPEFDPVMESGGAVFEDSIEEAEPVEETLTGEAEEPCADALVGADLVIEEPENEIHELEVESVQEEDNSFANVTIELEDEESANEGDPLDELSAEYAEEELNINLPAELTVETPFAEPPTLEEQTEESPEDDGAGVNFSIKDWDEAAPPDEEAEIETAPPDEEAETEAAPSDEEAETEAALPTEAALTSEAVEQTPIEFEDSEHPDFSPLESLEESTEEASVLEDAELPDFDIPAELGPVNEEVTITEEDLLEEAELPDFSVNIEPEETGKEIPPPEETGEEITLTEDAGEEIILTDEDLNIDELPDFNIPDKNASATDEADAELEPTTEEPDFPIEADIPVETDLPSAAKTDETKPASDIPADFRRELTAVLTYVDALLDALPDEKIEEFARSEQFEHYKKIFKELGINGT
ncbi:MAG: hypothetical protein LBG72_03225 [Spirochaetaceae bacterium]|jgi:hypothetical protein|nr:hypothetical protein [Spirochaetaceae bacterium]